MELLEAVDVAVVADVPKLNDEVLKCCCYCDVEVGVDSSVESGSDDVVLK